VREGRKHWNKNRVRASKREEKEREKNESREKILEQIKKDLSSRL